jgi:hypothetical protein
MRKYRMTYGRIVLGMCMAVAMCLSGFSRAEAAEQQQDREELKQEIRKEVTKEMEGMGMQLLTGDIWQQAPPDDKVAFVWGVCHVVTLENALMKKLPSLKVENFSAKAAEGLAGMKINDIVKGIDDYYVANPSELETPVVKVLWEKLIVPQLKTGITGYPLQ